MTALALALHILGAVVWVGGMFAIYVCLRPALGTLEPPQRLRLMRVTFEKFFPWVWLAILLLLASGYLMLFTTFGGFAPPGPRPHPHPHPADHSFQPAARPGRSHHRREWALLGLKIPHRGSVHGVIT